MGRREELIKEIEELESKKKTLKNEYEKYINKYLIKAELELKQIAFPNKQCQFIDINKLEIQYITGEKILAGYRHTNRNLYIDENYLIKSQNKHGYDKEMVQTLQHELIHYYCDENLDELNVHFCADSSPIFHSIIVFFNARGLDIKTNDNLDSLYKQYHQDLHKVAINKETTFEELIKYLYQWQKALKSKLKLIKEPSRYWGDDPKIEYNNEKSEYIDMEIFEGYKTKVFLLGMNCNLSNFEELVNKQ